MPIEVGDTVYRMVKGMLEPGRGIHFEYGVGVVKKGGGIERKSNDTFTAPQDVVANGLPLIPAVMDGETVVTPEVPAVPPALTGPQRTQLAALLKTQFDWCVANRVRLGWNLDPAAVEEA